jgi:hypothetical protein
MYYLDPMGELTLSKLREERLNRRLELMRLLASPDGEATDRSVLVRLVGSLGAATRRLRGKYTATPATLVVASGLDSARADSDRLAA